MSETQETWVQSLGLEDRLEEEMATHSSIPAWRIPWTEEPGGLQFKGLQRVRQSWATEHIVWGGGNRRRRPRCAEHKGPGGPMDVGVELFSGAPDVACLGMAAQ